jgi:dethiobiotin synthetase
LLDKESGVFITGTDTNIGKTLVSASLAWKLSKHKDKVCIMKPFATSNKKYSNRYNSRDLYLLLKSLKIKEEQFYLNPYFYMIAASPFMASEILNKEPSSIKIAFERFRYLRKKYNFVVVEGIGGIMVPLNDKHFLIDFIKLIKLPIIIVATPKVGTLNHILLTVKMCRNYRIPIRGIIFNKMPQKATIVEQKTPAFINKLTKIPILGIIPSFKNIKYNDNMFERISNLIDYPLIK